VDELSPAAILTLPPTNPFPDWRLRVPASLRNDTPDEIETDPEEPPSLLAPDFISNDPELPR
jgi:hypothetical protein